MSRSRKQRERKLKAKLHEAQVKAATIKKQLAMQNDVLVDYVGGVAEFGHAVLDMIGRTNFIRKDNGGGNVPISDYHAFGTHVLSTAVHMGFVERHQQSNGRFDLTHMCKQLLSSTVQKEDTHER